MTTTPAAAHRPWYTALYIQVLAIAARVVLGHFVPQAGAARRSAGARSGLSLRAQGR